MPTLYRIQPPQRRDPLLDQLIEQAAQSIQTGTPPDRRSLREDDQTPAPQRPAPQRPAPTQPAAPSAWSATEAPGRPQRPRLPVQTRIVRVLALAMQPIPVAGRIAIGALGLFFGILFWFLGAAYSLDGWGEGLRMLFDAVRIEPPPISMGDTSRLLAIVTLGLFYSCAEVAGRLPRGADLSTIGIVVVILLATHGTDLGSTWIALGAVEPDASPIAQWFAQAQIARGCATIALTYLPELSIIFGWRLLRGGMMEVAGWPSN